MEFIKKHLTETTVQKFLYTLLLIGLLISLRDLMNVILLTFIFAYVFSSCQSAIQRFLFCRIAVPSKLITVSLYVSFAAGVVFVFQKYMPLLTNEMVELGKKISNFKVSDLDTPWGSHFGALFKELNIQQYLSEGVNVIFHNLSHVGEVGLQVFLAFLLSFFLLLEKDLVSAFGRKMTASKIGPIISFYLSIGHKFANSFGKMLQLQILISFINAILSIIMLQLLGFSQVFALGVMIFILGLIPVAGVVISFIPLTIIAFQLGGVTKVMWLLVMILVLHALESYVLNPKLMSMRSKLPVFLTFTTLIVAQHFLGTWGLLIGLPLVMFFLDIIGATNDAPPENKKRETSSDVQ